MVINYDCVVAGGGPAGAFAARELTRAGCRVLMVDPMTGRPRLEGLSVRVAQLLSARGLEAVLQFATGPAPRTVDWSGLRNQANGEHLVQRPEFDGALRDAAVAAGADLVIGRIGQVRKDESGQGVVARLSTGETVRARLLIDARGRQAPSRQRLKGPATLALSVKLDGAAPAARTQVAATPQGWIWHAEAPGFGRWLQICVDADSLAGGGQDALAERLTRFLKQPHLEASLADATLAATVMARSCGLVLSAPELSLPVIPVGDAAVAIDPLSGHGLFWALSSALAAVPMVLTVLEEPVAGRQKAAEFYRSRVVETFWRQARVGRDFYRLEKNLSSAPFWARRLQWPDDQRVETASEAVRVERRIVVENNRLAERDVLITPQDPGGVAFVAGLPVRDLAGFVGLAPAGEPLPKTPSKALQTALLWLESRALFSSQTHPISDQTTRMRETA